jgi:hypothetical protein
MSNIITLLGYDNIRKSTIIAESPNEFWNGYNNEEDLENNFTVLSADIIEFHGGIAVTFAQKATVNPASFPDGVVISDFTIKEGTGGSTGTVACTVHGVSMSFRFSVCP